MVKISADIKNEKTDCLKDSTKNYPRKAIILEGKTRKQNLMKIHEQTLNNMDKQ